MTPLDNLRRIVAGWRGEWRVDAHDGITLSHDGDEWPIASMDGDAVIALVELLNAIRPAVDGATAEIERLTAELDAARQIADARREWLGTGDAAKSPPRTDTAAIAADMLACAEAWAPGAMPMGNVRADEIAAVCRELAAARGTVWHAIRRSGVRSGVEWIRWNVPSEDGPAAMMIRRDPGAAQWLCQWESDLLAGSDWDDFTFDDEAVDAPCEVLTVEFHSEAAGAWPNLTPVIDGRASQPATVGGLLATAPTVEATAEEGARMARRIGDTYDLTIPVGRGRALAAMKLAEAIIASGHPHRSEP